MTPPNEYRDNSVGIPLPGMATRLTQKGELEIGGPYMARYLEQLGGDDPGSAVFNARTDAPWMKTVRPSTCSEPDSSLPYVVRYACQSPDTG